MIQRSRRFSFFARNIASKLTGPCVFRRAVPRLRYSNTVENDPAIFASALKPTPQSSAPQELSDVAYNQYADEIMEKLLDSLEELGERVTIKEFDVTYNVFHSRMTYLIEERSAEFEFRSSRSLRHQQTTPEQANLAIKSNKVQILLINSPHIEVVQKDLIIPPLNSGSVGRQGGVSTTYSTMRLATFFVLK